MIIVYSTHTLGKQATSGKCIPYLPDRRSESCGKHRRLLRSIDVKAELLLLLIHDDRYHMSLQQHTSWSNMAKPFKKREGRGEASGNAGPARWKGVAKATAKADQNGAEGRLSQLKGSIK